MGYGSACPGRRTLLTLCRYGDLEAVEDFIDIGRDANDRQDADRRSPLHYAVAYSHADIAGAAAASWR